MAEYIAMKLAGRTTDPRDAIKIARLSKTKEDVDRLTEYLYRRD